MIYMFLYYENRFVCYFISMWLCYRDVIITMTKYTSMASRYPNFTIITAQFHHSSYYSQSVSHITFDINLAPNSLSMVIFYHDHSRPNKTSVLLLFLTYLKNPFWFYIITIFCFITVYTYILYYLILNNNVIYTN